MKEYLLHLTKYNHDANSKVIRILEEMKEEDRTADRKSYYRSLHGLLDHIAGGALFLQKIIKSSRPELGGLSHPYIDREFERGKTRFPDFSELKAAVTAIDLAFIDMVAALTDDDLSKPVMFTTPKGTTEYSLAVFIMQYVSHGTHHRGQISQILDELQIDNNFSGIAPKYE